MSHGLVLTYVFGRKSHGLLLTYVLGDIYTPSEAATPNRLPAQSVKRYSSAELCHSCLTASCPSREDSACGRAG